MRRSRRMSSSGRCISKQQTNYFQFLLSVEDFEVTSRETASESDKLTPQRRRGREGGTVNTKDGNRERGNGGGMRQGMRRRRRTIKKTNSIAVENGRMSSLWSVIYFIPTEHHP
jgi:hypothetical protein